MSNSELYLSQLKQIVGRGEEKIQRTRSFARELRDVAVYVYLLYAPRCYIARRSTSFAVRDKMMYRMFAFFLTTLLLNAEVLVAQESQRFSIKGLDRTEMIDGFEISGVVYIYHNSALPKADYAARDLSQLIPVDRAAIHGSPDASERALIELFYESEVEFEIESVSARRCNGSRYIWRVESSVSRSFFACGYGDNSAKYIGYVNADGSLIEPSRYIVNHSRVGNNSLVYSTLSFAELTKQKAKEPRVDGEEALRIARAKLDAFSAEASKSDVQIKTRFHDQQRLEIPIRMKNTGDQETSAVWKVRFLPNYIMESDDPFYNCIVVWVTDGGVTSELSLNSWQAKDEKRLKHE